MNRCDVVGNAKLKTNAHNLLEKYFSGETMSYQTMVAILIPILVDQAFVISLNLLNSAMISSSGVAAISAVSMVDSLNIFLVNVFIAVSTGGTVVVAQYKGAGNDSMVSKAAAGAISSVFLLSAAIGLSVIAFHTGVLNLLFGQAEHDVFQNAKIYLIGSAISYGGIAIEESVCGALRGVGETKSSLTLSLIMNISYVLLNVVFINILHMGVLGMVISLNVSRYFAAFCAILFLLKRNESLRFHLQNLLDFDLSMLKRIMYIGIPFAAEQMFFNGGKILTQTFIVQLGTYAMATNAICNSLSLLFQIPANALSLCLVTVVGQCMGRRNVDDARKFIKSTLWLGSISFALMGILILPFFQPLASLFHPPEAIIHSIFLITLINTIAQIPLWSVSFITPAAIRAAGDSKYTSIVSMLSMWLFRVVLGYVLGIVLNFGILGVWIAMDCEWGVRGIIFLHRFKGKKWYAHNLIN